MPDRHRMRVRRLEAIGVLGEFDHAVEFAPDSNLFIVYGPNGVGKTKFLEVVDALAQLDGARLNEIPFKHARIYWESGDSLSVARGTKPGFLRFELHTKDGERIPWDMDGGGRSRLVAFLTMETSWRPLDGTTWQDQRDGEYADIRELEMRYGPRLWTPEERNARLHRQREQVNLAPESLRAFSDSFHTHLIETQRLRIEDQQERPPRYAKGVPPRLRRPQSTIVGYSAEMREGIEEALAQNSKTTQYLDRTFPRRVLTETSEASGLRTEDIRAKYEQQNKLRSRIADIAGISMEAELPMPDRDLQPFELSMLDLYLRDSNDKLQTFDEILKKIELLEEIVNSRLLGKELKVNATDGLSVVRSGAPIDLNALSSGEQHEIILMYRLLFKVQPGSLVLIDEPEISLHVSWQLAFISDVNKIAKLVGFQLLVATHSPQIINDWWSYSKQLGPVGAEI